MLLPDEQEFLDYITENYSERKRPALKEWTFQSILTSSLKIWRRCCSTFLTGRAVEFFNDQHRGMHTCTGYFAG